MKTIPKSEFLHFPWPTEYPPSYQATRGLAPPSRGRAPPLRGCARPLRVAARGPWWRAAVPPLLASAGRVKREGERDFG